MALRDGNILSIFEEDLILNNAEIFGKEEFEIVEKTKSLTREDYQRALLQGGGFAARSLALRQTFLGTGEVRRKIKRDEYISLLEDEESPYFDESLGQALRKFGGRSVGDLRFMALENRARRKNALRGQGISLSLTEQASLSRDFNPEVGDIRNAIFSQIERTTPRRFKTLSGGVLEVSNREDVLSANSSIEMGG